jgi:hypothetical protein
LPGGPDRTADLVAILEDPTAPEQPWLLVFEFQGQPDPEKLDVTLEEVAILRGHARHGDDRKGKYAVLAALVYLVGECPSGLLDMTVEGGFGTRHAALVWDVAKDSAGAALDAVSSGQESWPLLFWVALMAGAEEDAIVSRWKEVVAATVPDRQARSNLAGIALVFAELAGRFLAWERGLEGWDMTESQVVNRWMSQGELARARKDLLDAIKVRFPGALTEEIAQLINQQDSSDLLREWFLAALKADTFDQFLDVLKR